MDCIYWSINFGPYFKYAHITFLFLNFPWHIWVEVKSTIPLTHQLMHRLTHCQHFERVSQHTTGTSTETLPKHWLTQHQHTIIRCFTFLYVIRITSGQYIFWRSTNCQMTDMSANALAKTSMGWVLYLLPYLINSYRLFMYSMTLRNKACLCFQFRSTTYAHSCRTHQ